MAKSLLYILKISIIPIIALIGGRLLGMWLASILLGYNLTWDFSSPSAFLNPSTPNYDLINLLTFANLIMYAVLAIGMSIVLIQSSYFHDSHLDVTFVSKLADLNLLGMIKSTYQLYHWGFVWTIYLFIGTFVILFDVISGRCEVWVVIVSFVFPLFSLLVLIKDVFNEINIAKSLVVTKNYEGE